MNRRELLALLPALPATARISRATVQPTDTIIIECKDALSEEATENLVRQLRALWPEPQRVAVFTKGIRIKILGQS